MIKVYYMRNLFSKIKRRLLISRTVVKAVLMLLHFQGWEADVLYLRK